MDGLLSDESALQKPKFAVEYDKDSTCVERHPVQRGVEVLEKEEEQPQKNTTSEQKNVEPDDTMTNEEMYYRAIYS